ncbi:MAG TPA: MmcQ/YjbR family DNA-binding protein, partial [Tepidiformaceae bacterium]|nr:MmcQ/YjbR family DNA-binding protein [Tepidiformaceae bacterium]
SAWLKAADGAQAILVASNPARFFVPPYQGTAGWVGVYLDADEPDWDELATLIEDAFRLVAPKKLLTALEARPN